MPREETANVEWFSSLSDVMGARRRESLPVSIYGMQIEGNHAGCLISTRKLCLYICVDGCRARMSVRFGVERCLEENLLCHSKLGPPSSPLVHVMHAQSCRKPREKWIHTRIKKHRARPTSYRTTTSHLMQLLQ